ncbi:MAG: hypothetical protein RM049_10930 [Nostoc sp. DedQUE04]|uniref:hypothetical protein n=1 Tax=Nostoc sp. DedQUE04 TaxID=3075390 RepID=UPI002AD1E187|nr:hypothetical protein [Nostoc sp. DedQUE04]MDZ8135800.1 hypothetical protein [Nostoc sp. DedQUE04]
MIKPTSVIPLALPLVFLHKRSQLSSDVYDGLLYERLRQRLRRWGVRSPFCLSQAIAVQLDRLPLVSYFNPDCDLSLSLSCSKMTVILEPSGFSQTKVAIVAELLTSVP